MKMIAKRRRQCRQFHAGTTGGVFTIEAPSVTALENERDGAETGDAVRTEARTDSGAEVRAEARYADRYQAGEEGDTYQCDL